MSRTRIGAAGVAVVTAAALLTACMTYDPYTGEREVSKTTKGAVIGGAAGAATGLIWGDNHRERRKRALIGAGIGALAGGAVGNYMDRQEAKLRAQLQGTGVSVTRMGDNLILNMPGNVTFETDRSDIRADFFDVLHSVSLVLKEFDKTLIEAAGHTDSTGTHEYNQSLSERRADSVRRYLRAQGIPDLRIIALGYGETRPIANNDTVSGRAQNRRVELTLIPVTE